MEIEIPKETEIIILTGPESSGKSTLSARLAEKYGYPRIKEYARTYLSEHGLVYSFDDLIIMAQYQMELERNANRESEIIICDTDLVTYEIWAMDKFQEYTGLEDSLTLKKFYLLCTPDIPWEPDPMRENPHDRDRLFANYLVFLKERNLPFAVVNNSNRNHMEFQFL